MTELEQLKAKLAARRGKTGFGANLKAIEQRIAEIEAEASESAADSEGRIDS